jgi:hypothetical protein
MTENFQPSEDIFDDVEGHMPRIKPPLEVEDSDDVEGHLGGKTVPLEAEDNEKGWKRP